MIIRLRPSSGAALDIYRNAWAEIRAAVSVQNRDQLLVAQLGGVNVRARRDDRHQRLSNRQTDRAIQYRKRTEIPLAYRQTLVAHGCKQVLQQLRRMFLSSTSEVASGVDGVSKHARAVNPRVVLFKHPRMATSR